MTKFPFNLLVTIMLVLAFDSVAMAQQPAPPAKISVKLQFVVSKYDGDRKISSLPYMLFATIGQQTSLLLGNNVPLVTSTSTADGKPTTNISYTNVGMTFQCTVAKDADHFNVQLNIDDKSVIDVKPTAPESSNSRPLDSPSFRDFNFVGMISLKEGESKQIVSAADRTSGEVEKVDITLTLDR